MESKERRKKGANCFILMGGRFNKKGYLHTSFVLDDHKKNKSPFSPVRIFKVYIEVLPGFSHVNCPGGVSTAHCFLKAEFLWQLLAQGEKGGRCIPRTGERMRGL